MHRDAAIAECSRPLSWLGIAWAPMETASLLLRAQWGLLETLNERVEGAAERGEAMLVLLNQLLFLMLCDRWFCPGDRLTGLYTLLFYIILCYLCHYVGNLLNVRGYSPYVHVSDQSKIRHLAMSVTKVRGLGGAPVLVVSRTEEKGLVFWLKHTQGQSC